MDPGTSHLSGTLVGRNLFFELKRQKLDPGTRKPGSIIAPRMIDISALRGGR